MECGVVHDQRGVGRELRKQMIGEPLVEPVGCGCAGKQEGSQQFLAPLRRNQAGAWAPFAAVLAVNFLSAIRPASRTMRLRRKAGFINIYEALAALIFNDGAQFLQICDSFKWISFEIPQRFF